MRSCAYPALPPPVRVPLTICPEHPCAYLPGRHSQVRAFASASVPGEVYHQFMDAGFRRSGDMFYQPVCRGCRACVPLRVQVARFVPTKSQRRSMRRNADLKVTVGTPEATDEKVDLYRRYCLARHGKHEDRTSLEQFLYESPVETFEVCHRDAAGRLVGVGICDICRDSVSSVYFYFDPDEHRRSPGTYSALVEIELARQYSIPWYYLGYWIAGCRTMEYKTTFRPCQYLGHDGVWRDSSPNENGQGTGVMP